MQKNKLIQIILLIYSHLNLEFHEPCVKFNCKSVTFLSYFTSQVLLSFYILMEKNCFSDNKERSYGIMLGLSRLLLRFMLSFRSYYHLHFLGARGKKLQKIRKDSQTSDFRFSRNDAAVRIVAKIRVIALISTGIVVGNTGHAVRCDDGFG